MRINKPHNNILTLAVFLCISAPSHLVFAGEQSTFSASPVQSERLSAFLIRNNLTPPAGHQLNSMLLGRASLLAKQNLELTKLRTLLAIKQSDVPSYLIQWSHQWQATGRQILPVQDGHELAIKPQLDPILNADDQVFLYPPAQHVLVLSDTSPCLVQHQPFATVQNHLQTCFAKSKWYRFDKGFDQVWVIHPNGDVKQLNVGGWNSKEISRPPPGSIIWAPTRSANWAENESNKLVEVLRKQSSYQLIEQFSQNHANQAALTVTEDLIEANPKPFGAGTNVPTFGIRHTRSDWGSVGLLQMPNARMAPAGTISLTASRVEPYSRYSFIYQPFDWLEAGFRYSIITNRRFGPEAFSGDRKYQDKSVDFKLKLLDESAYLPHLAVGMRDIGGTGLFASEYFVASKNWGKIDFTLGLGFGNMATGSSGTNPFAWLSDEFKTRPNANVGTGGTTNSGTYFRGESALFGGIEWQTPWRDLIFKVEYDGNDYSQEPLGNPQAHDSHLNFGFTYRVNDTINLSLGVERGNTVGVALSFEENVSKYAAPKLADPDPVRVLPGPRPKKADWQQTWQQVEQQTTWNLDDISQRGSEVRLVVDGDNQPYPQRAADKASAVLHANLPEDVRWFAYQHEQRGLKIAEHVVDRIKWAKNRTELAIETEQQETVAIEPNTMPHRTLYKEKEPWYDGRVSLAYQQNFGGSDGYLFRFTLAARGEVRFNKQTWLTGRIDQIIGGTFDDFTQGAVSSLPQVRTRIRDYATASDTNLTNLQLNHIGDLSQNHYYSLYGGYLESMFAGVGGEYLYRPFHSNWALGVDLNRVQQREFEQDFDLLNYTVNTGHVTAYVDTGFEDILATISAGQYLAGDKGITLELSRVFENGVKIGAYATKTNVSAEDFGEGSFDKGIYVQVPLDALFISTISGSANFVWSPIIRDGGAKLRRQLRLFDHTQLRSPRALTTRPALP